METGWKRNVAEYPSGEPYSQRPFCYQEGGEEEDGEEALRLVDVEHGFRYRVRHVAAGGEPKRLWFFRIAIHVSICS